jgi:hypothetical protein
MAGIGEPMVPNFGELENVHPVTKYLITCILYISCGFSVLVLENVMHHIQIPRIALQINQLFDDLVIDKLHGEFFGRRCPSGKALLARLQECADVGLEIWMKVFACKI